LRAGPGLGISSGSYLSTGRPMTNKIAIFLGLLIAAGLIWDFGWNERDASFFMARKTIELIEWVAFWR